MKPFRIFLFLAATLLALAALAYVFPVGGISFGDITIRMPRLQEILSPNEAKYADISNIVETPMANEINNQKKASKPAGVDAITLSDEEIRKQNTEKIQYSPKHPHALEPFFSLLYKKQNENAIIRILHYGDSQIEGDHITQYLRAQLQKRFGGQGCGQIGLASSSPVGGMQITRGKEWEIHSIIKPHHKKNAFYGTTMSFLLAPDTMISDNPYPFEINMTRKHCPSQEATLYCGSIGEGKTLQIHADDSCISQKTFHTPVSWTEHRFHIPPKTKKLSIKTSSRILLYSISFQGNTGVLVDNIPLRGSAGWNFSDNIKEPLSAMYQLQNVKLLIMQFGVNAVPEDPDEVVENFGFYQAAITKELRYLKSLDPELCIVVIGISDRSRKAGEGYETNPNVLKIREAQRNAAFNTGCAYWDLFNAMGGENSMPSWVMNNPPLANSDFVHFNNKGAQLVGELFYKAFLQEYLEYAEQQAHNTNR